ncbi:Acetolactate synthase large subunit [Caulifigura coniformis]|uniref:Acetolactate synthase n=1 Tax=Caulifigura coniformis TaxID=2527983 RepID=A0A517SK23_9PLAN|nr:biosynthetic-type acetolactate synthase large subunit [Caulifigura coniformis]QDT56466.1 Acetolactate synthase large subunit [Caulifigura coniformis]
MATAPASQTTKTETLNGADVLVEALVRNGGKMIFAYPGGASMPLHQALRRHREKIRTILPRHEQGGGFAAQGVSRTSDDVGLCMATSGPGATNLVTAIADAKMDSVPLIAITGQVPQQVIGSDAFQETPIVEICRAVTKHHYLITAEDPNCPESVQKTLRDIPRIVKEAFYLAKTGRPGPILIDFPKNVQLSVLEGEIDWDPPFELPGYNPEPKPVSKEQIKQVIAAIKRSRKPILYVGGGVINSGAAAELTKFAKKSNIPVTMTVMGLGAFPGEDPQSLHMLGMHGTVYANYAINEADLLLALGVRFDDRVTGKLEEFALHGKIVHVDIDASEMHKNKEAHIPIIGDVGDFLTKLNAEYTDADKPDTAAWWTQVNEWKERYPLSYKEAEGDAIRPQYAIEELWRQSKARNPYVAVGVGQHQMFAAQFFKFDKPKHWLSSSGLGTMGFGLPAAMGVQARHPNDLVINIDGDGSILMNIQEFATLHCEKLPIKILLLNNQHLGMVMQWEDRFMEGKRAHTYLGPIDHPEWLGEGSGDFYEATYPNFVQIAKGFGLQARHVRSRKELPAAIAEMIASPEPYLLDVITPYQEHVLPMIPGGKSVRDIITE